MSIGCSVRPEPGQCVVYLAERSPGYSLEITRRHERGHCNGWPADHLGARPAGPNPGD
jgi:hypothetical protein